MKKNDLKSALVSIVLISLIISNGLAFIFNNFNETQVQYSINTFNSNLESSGIINKTLFEDDFEGGLSKWASVTGLWHLTNSSSSWSDPYNSFEHSMWFGQESTGDYDTGSLVRSVGNLTSVPFDLSSLDEAYLEFYHWTEIELSSTYDNGFVYISIDGSSWDLLEKITTNITAWEEKVYNITSYCGNSAVQIRFLFDSVDGRDNNYRGWLIDDVEVSGWEDDVTSPVITISPSNYTVEFGYTGESLSWTVTDINPLNYTLELLGTGIVAGPTAWTSGGAVTYNIPDGKAIGEYIYTINFTDLGGNSVVDYVNFTVVVDTTSPLITLSPSNFTAERGYTGESMSWTVTELNPLNYTIELQGTGFVVNATPWTSGVEVTYDIPDGYAIGSYIYIVNFTDDNLNYVVDYVNFTVVEDVTSPLIVLSPSNFTVERGYSGESMSWTLTDLNPLNYTIELQGTGFVVNATPWTSGVEVIYNIPDGFSIGSYIYTVNFTDDQLNFVVDYVNFTVVEDTTNPNITVSPNDFSIEFAYTGETLSWTATDNNPVNYTIELLGTGIVAGPLAWTSGIAIIYNIPDGYAIGTYVFIVNFTDDMGGFITANVTVTVEDTTDPVVTVNPSDFTIAFVYTGKNITWTATDLNPSTYTVALQGTGVVAGPTAWTSGIAVTFDIPDGLAAGVYVYTITFMDTEGNSASDVVSVTVEEAIVIPPDDGLIWIILIAVLGGGGVVVILTVVLLKKRKT